MQPDVAVLADIVAAAIKVAQAPLLTRIALLEGLPSTKSAEVIVGPPGPPGRDADVDAVKAAVLTAISPVVSDDAIQQVVYREVAKALAAVEMPRDGKDADVEAVKRDVVAELKPTLAQDLVSLVSNEVTKAFAGVQIPKDGQDGANGKDADMDEVRSIILTEVVKAVGAVPLPKDGQDGRSVEIADLVPVIEAHVTKAMSAVPLPKDGTAGTQGEPGQSVELSDVKPVIVAEVAKTHEQWERPKDGASVTIDDVAPMIAAEVSKAFSVLPVPKDGVGLAGALVDRDGQFVVTLTDGTVKELGTIVGRDGRDVDMDAVTKQIADAVAQIPRPKDGEPGRDGTLENLKVIRQDERTIVLAFKDGTPIEGGTLRFDHPVFKKTYSEQSRETYTKGDLVRWGGSGYIALKDSPPGKPGAGTSDQTGWELWIKRGDEGKPGKDGKDLRVGKGPV